MSHHTVQSLHENFSILEISSLITHEESSFRFTHIDPSMDIFDLYACVVARINAFLTRATHLPVGMIWCCIGPLFVAVVWAGSNIRVSHRQNL